MEPSGYAVGNTEIGRIPGIVKLSIIEGEWTRYLSLDNVAHTATVVGSELEVKYTVHPGRTVVPSEGDTTEGIRHWPVPSPGLSSFEKPAHKAD